MKFELQKYLNRNKDSNSIKSKEHIGLEEGDFSEDSNLVSIVKKDGICNDIKFSVDSGIIINNNNNMLIVEIKD